MLINTRDTFTPENSLLASPYDLIEIYRRGIYTSFVEIIKVS